ncbi:MAG: ATP-binding cassette domain-containing protein, partial [Clostridia bacterium]|nr:ATP-binding cassette domain-containing protein [Clostridia bacterium]
MELYKIETLDFAYSGAEAPVLSGITFSVNQGEFVTLCGQSGCGKTTLLRLLKPALAPAGTKTGQISFCGTEITEMEERVSAAEIGFVMQNPENQTVTDKVWHELAFGLESLGLPTPEIRARVSEMAAFFGIDQWFHQKVADLSGGQKQLLNLASVMVLQPKVLILDEPTGQLDPIAAREFLQTLSRINRELGTTVILSEHRLEEVIPMSDRVLVLDGGRLIANGKPRELGGMLKTHPIYHALPTPIRIHDAVEAETECPITVREGRLWLEDYAERKTIQGQRISPPDGKILESDIILEVKDVRFRYQKDDEDILRDFSITIRRGERYALLGGNGVGKTTALSVMGGLLSPQRGQVLMQGTPLFRIPDLYRGKVGVLPQDPKTLFVHKTVRLELEDSSAGMDGSRKEEEERIRQIAALCRIDHLLSRHPYDLSGGEQQRVALAKVLLRMPELLLLDEPTKGMDAAFKEEFAEILQDLKEKGITVVLVSHDIEFCAEFADRCGLLFDGSITAEDIPRRFFSGKSFYTTSASRMARGVLPDAILAKDVILACGGKAEEPPKEKREVPPLAKPARKQEEEREKPKGRVLRILSGFLLGILFLLTCVILQGQPPEKNTVLLQILSIVELGGCLLCFFHRKERTEPVRTPCPREKLPKRTRIATLLILLAVPLTVYWGMTYLEDRKYYLISSLILGETLLPFFLLWERNNISYYNVCIFYC